jgi:hypothetical protein
VLIAEITNGIVPITEDRWKGPVLAKLAAAQALYDTDRAERLAQSITDECWKAVTPTGAAKALAR